MNSGRVELIDGLLVEWECRDSPETVRTGSGGTSAEWVSQSTTPQDGDDIIRRDEQIYAPATGGTR